MRVWKKTRNVAMERSTRTSYLLFSRRLCPSLQKRMNRIRSFFCLSLLAVTSVIDMINLWLIIVKRWFRGHLEKSSPVSLSPLITFARWRWQCWSRALPKSYLSHSLTPNRHSFLSLSASSRFASGRRRRRPLELHFPIQFRFETTSFLSPKKPGCIPSTVECK